MSDTKFSNSMIDQYHNAPPGVQNAIKRLRTNIRFSAVDRPIQTIVITSAEQDEGKTGTSVYLAIAMAEAGKKTLVINTDCYKPYLGSRMGRKATKTWTDLLYGDATAEEAIMPTTQENLYFLEADQSVAYPVELIGSKKFSNMIDKLKESIDIIIFDTPPLGAFIEAALLAEKADGTILVMKSGSTDAKVALDVVEQLKKANAHLLGVVLTDVEQSSHDTYYYYNYHGKKPKRFGRRKKK